ncbi:hypothetical protein [Streptomyces sp. Rer75]|uniref:hypothetical protein n=1 Tax=Streptomyces sp. Rer75 TaxID=2750011 RepID=UPI0015D0B633|nr:hypothetical protein [Streptomyces sp. Rer75]QLH20467.1 hypothetical protein HYQ63_07290 [Streptomyces sp. Rer75]
MVEKIDTVGRIRAGDEAGKYVRIQELPDSPPGYLILMARDRDFRDGCGDYWVEDRESLEAFFAEGDWIIEWA